MRNRSLAEAGLHDIQEGPVMTAPHAGSPSIPFSAVSRVLRCHLSTSRALPVVSSLKRSANVLGASLAATCGVRMRRKGSPPAPVMEARVRTSARPLRNIAAPKQELLWFFREHQNFGSFGTNPDLAQLKTHQLCSHKALTSQKSKILGDWYLDLDDDVRGCIWAFTYLVCGCVRERRTWKRDSWKFTYLSAVFLLNE